MAEEEISWDEAVKSGEFVQLEEDTEKTLVLTKHRLVRRGNDVAVAKGEVEFVAEVVTEDGETPPQERKFTTTSKRLKKKLRPIFENKKPEDQTTLTILRVGDKFDTQYSVKEVKEK